MSYEYQIPAFYLINTIPFEPIKKVRILCEALIGSTSAGKREQFEDLYKVAVALDSAKEGDEPICIAWPFECNQQNFDKYIAPWLKRFPDFSYRNPLERDNKLKELRYVTYEKEENGKVTQYTYMELGWQNFFIITTKLGLSPIALSELKAEFSVHAMKVVMPAITEMLKDVPVLVPSAALKPTSQKPTEKFTGVEGRLEAK